MNIYSANFGGYDTPMVSTGRQWIDERNTPVEVISKGFTSLATAKMHKVLNPNNHDVWLDASIEIIGDVGEFLDLFSDCDMAFVRYPMVGDGQWDREVSILSSAGWLPEEDKARIVKEVYNDQPPSQLLCGGIVYRNPQLDWTHFNRKWWALICQYSWRDQLTLPAALQGMEYKMIDINMFDNPYWKVHPHNYYNHLEGQRNG